MQWAGRLMADIAIRLVLLISSASAVIFSTSSSLRNVTFEGCASLFGVDQESLNAIASPNYPKKYPPNQNCVRVVQANAGYDIVVKFNYFFQIESSYGVVHDALKEPSCPNDFIEFRDGRYGFSPLIARLCGSQLPAIEIKATSGYLWIRFHSDDYLEYKGFHATYEMVRTMTPPPPSQECHFEVHDNLDGWIDTSALQDFRHGVGALECVWRIETPSHVSISIAFVEFELARPNHCEANFVEIFAGTEGRPMRRFCGLTASSVFSANALIYVRVKLASHSLLARTKVVALYSSYITDQNCTQASMFACGDGKCIPPHLVCNGNANCPYASDERQCEARNRSAVKSFLKSGYAPLIMLILLVSISVLSLYIWSFHAYLCNCRSPSAAPVDNGVVVKDKALLAYAKSVP